MENSSTKDRVVDEDESKIQHYIETLDEKQRVALQISQSMLHVRVQDTIGFKRSFENEKKNN